jgi:hypothetical protein
MVELQTQARLVEPGRFDARGVTTVLRRAEIERAVADGAFPAQLRLELSRLTGADEEPETGDVLVAWDEAELHELLRSSDSDEITLWFDEAGLEQALAGDVEAHGIRERTAVVAISVVAAGAAAGGAFAHPQTVGMAGGGAGHAALAQSFMSDVASSDAVARYETNMAAAQPVSDVASSDALARYETNMAATQPVSDVASSDALARYETNMAATQPVSDVASSDALARYETNMAAAQPVSDVASSDALARYETNAAGSQADAISRYEANVTAGSEGDALSRYQSNVAADTTPVTTATASTSQSLTAGEDAAIAAGALLLITGAGFVATRTRRQNLRPA